MLKTVMRLAIFVWLVTDVYASESGEVRQTVERGNDCPATIVASTRFLIVSTNGMTSPIANIQLFQRESKFEVWRSAGPSWLGTKCGSASWESQSKRKALENRLRGCFEWAHHSNLRLDYWTIASLLRRTPLPVSTT